MEPDQNTVQQDTPSFNDLISNAIRISQNEPKEVQDSAINIIKKEYLAGHPDMEPVANDVIQRAFTVNQRASGNGRYIPDKLVTAAPWQDKKFELLSKSERIKKIETYKIQADEIARQDEPYRATDYAQYLREISTEQIRKVNGEDTGRASDLALRIGQGFTTRLLKTVGAGSTATTTAECFPVNVDYDNLHVSNAANNLGDIIAIISIIGGFYFAFKHLRRVKSNPK